MRQKFYHEAIECEITETVNAGTYDSHTEGTGRYNTRYTIYRKEKVGPDKAVAMVDTEFEANQLVVDMADTKKHKALAKAHAEAKKKVEHLEKLLGKQIGAIYPTFALLRQKMEIADNLRFEHHRITREFLPEHLTIWGLGNYLRLVFDNWSVKFREEKKKGEQK